MSEEPERYLLLDFFFVLYTLFLLFFLLISLPHVFPLCNLATEFHTNPPPISSSPVQQRLHQLFMTSVAKQLNSLFMYLTHFCGEICSVSTTFQVSLWEDLQLPSLYQQSTA